jgi:CRP/FNR family transcriptional regulator, cyclic AMP receptor protein
MQTLEPLLAEHPFFSRLDARFIELLVGCASNVRFEAGQYVFREGEDANQFYIIRRGHVALEIFAPGRGPLAVQTVGEGEIVGWSWLIPPYHWHSSARAVELTRAFALDAACLRKKCEEDHDLGYELFKRFTPIIVDRLQATRLQLLDLYGLPA